ncbi:MAG: type VII toxin-antitoxin system MntA family adenylyltransferase antitoxin [Acidobacteriota bacterium]
MNLQKQKIDQLRKYFCKKESVILAFVFGSKAKGNQRLFSDWDIAVYFKPSQYCEMETDIEYPEEHEIWGDLEKILTSNKIDLLVLNRANPSLLFSVLNSGIDLSIKDRRLYIDLLIKSHYEAVDWWSFTKEFYEIAERAESLSEEEKSVLRIHIRFLESEFADLKKFEKMTRQVYFQDNDQRRNVERWVENLVMSAIDISKIILASDKKEIPQTYRETLLRFSIRFMGEERAKKFSRFAELRNILTHEYLDVKWDKISHFVKKASKYYPLFIEEAKQYLKSE